MTGRPADLRDRLRSVHTYVVTPFRDDDVLAVDHDGLAANLSFLVENGITVVAVGGGTGEADALSSAEQAAIARTAVDAVGDRAVVIATLPGDLGTAAELIGEHERTGVDVLLAIPPQVRWKVPPDPAGTVAYYRRLGEVASVPLMPYNVQGWPVEMFERLADIDRIIGIKDPCLDDLPFFSAIQRLGDRFVWIGNKRHDPGVLQLRYQMGMEGFTTGMTNFLPEPELRMHAAAVDRDWDRLVALQALAAELERARRASDDAAMVKACMDAVGLRGGRVRPPRVDIAESERSGLAPAIEALRSALADMEGTDGSS